MSTLTSAIASGFICSSCPLLPVSIVDTPSIMMLFCPPPPRRVVVPVTPGVSAVRVAKLRPVPIGRFSTSVVVMRNERSPLCDWMRGASPVTVIVSLAPPTEIARSPIADAVAAAERDAVAAQAFEAVHRNLDGVGVGAGVGEHEVAVAACDRRRRSRAAALADEDDCGTRHREPLFILHRPGRSCRW